MLSKTARKFAMLLAAATFIVEPCLIQPCASVEWNPLNWQLPSSTAGDPQEVGTKAWWKKHKKKAEFVPGEGFRVEGFAGYFDQEGRPIQAKVAKVDIDENPMTPSKFMVRGIPTLLLFKDGNLKETIVGLANKDDLAKLIDKHL